jgi:hypothetical protein
MLDPTDTNLTVFITHINIYHCSENKTNLYYLQRTFQSSQCMPAFLNI